MVDASIPLQVQQAPVQSPMQSIGKLMQLQGSLDARALHQAQIQTEHIQQQAAQVKLDEQKREIGEQQTFQEALKGGLGYEGTLNQLEKAGKVSPAFTVKARENFAKAVRERSLAGAAELEGHNKRLQTLGGGLAAIQLLDPAERPAAYSQWRTQMIADPELSEDAKKLDEQYSDSLANRAKWMGGLTKDVNDAAIKLQQEQRAADKEKRDVQLFAETLKEKKAQATHAEQVAEGTVPLTPAQKQAHEDAQKTTDYKNYELSKKEGYKGTFEQWQTTDANRRRPLTQIVQPQYKDGKLVVSPTAQMAAEGRLDPATLRAVIRKNPTIVAEIKQASPDWDEADIEKRYAVGKEMSSSSNTKAGGQVIALNTLVHHADLYLKSAEALKNGTFKPGNAAYNAVASMFGSAPPQNAALVARFLAGETGKVATGGVPAEGEIKGVLANLPTNASPEQIEGAGKTIMEIASGRAVPIIEKVKDAKLDKIYPVFGADAKEILTRRGFDPETMKPRAATGAGGVAPIKLKSGKFLNPHDAAAAEAFRRDHADLIQ